MPHIAGGSAFSLGSTTRIVKTISTPLGAALVCGLIGLAFADHAMYRAIAPWVFIGLPICVFIGFRIWRYDLDSRRHKIFGMNEQSEYDDKSQDFFVAWIVVSILMVCLWFLPRVMPHTTHPAQPPTSSQPKL